MIGRDPITLDRDQITAERDAITVERRYLGQQRNGWDGARSIEFSDTSSKYIDFGNNTQIKNLFDSTRPFSVSVWMKMQSSGNVHFGKFSTLEDANGRGFLFYSSGSATMRVLLRDNFTTSSQIEINIGTVSTNTWFNLIVTYDGSKTGAGFVGYAGGELIAAGTGTITGTTETNGVASIGKTYASDLRSFSVCNYAIWDRALTRDEVIEVFKNGRNYNLLDCVVPPNVRYYPILAADDITSDTGFITDLVGGVDGIPRNTTTANLSSSAPTVEPRYAPSVFRPQFTNLDYKFIDLRSKDVNASLVSITSEPRAGVNGAIITGFGSSAIADGFDEGVQYTLSNPILSSKYPDPKNCILFVENQYRYASSTTNAPTVAVIYGDRFGAGFEAGSGVNSVYVASTASADESNIVTRTSRHRTYAIMTIPPEYSITGYQGILNYSATADGYGMVRGNNTGGRSGNILTGKWSYALCHDVSGSTATEFSTKHKYAVEKLFSDTDPVSIDDDWIDVKVSDLDIANPVGSFGSQVATLTQNGAYIDVSTTGDNTLNDGLGECINYKLLNDLVNWGDGFGKYIVVRVETITAPSQDANGFGIQLTAYDGNATNPSTNASIGIGVKSNTNGTGEWCPTMSDSTTNGSNVASSGATCVVYGVMPVWGDVGNKDNPSGAREAWMTGEHVWSYNTITDAWINPGSQSASSARLCTNNPDQLTGQFRMGVAVTTPAVLTTCTFTVRISYKVLSYPQPFGGIDF